MAGLSVALGLAGVGEIDKGILNITIPIAVPIAIRSLDHIATKYKNSNTYM